MFNLVNLALETVLIAASVVFLTLPAAASSSYDFNTEKKIPSSSCSLAFEPEQEQHQLLNQLGLRYDWRKKLEGTAFISEGENGKIIYLNN